MKRQKIRRHGGRGQSIEQVLSRSEQRSAIASRGYGLKDRCVLTQQFEGTVSREIDTEREKMAANRCSAGVLTPDLDGGLTHQRNRSRQSMALFDAEQSWWPYPAMARRADTTVSSPPPLLLASHTGQKGKRLARGSAKHGYERSGGAPPFSGPTASPQAQPPSGLTRLPR